MSDIKHRWLRSPFLRKKGDAELKVSWIRIFAVLIIPCVTGILATRNEYAGASNLIAAAGILAAVLIQVLVWVGGRMGQIADSVAFDGAPKHVRLRLERLQKLHGSLVYCVGASLALLALLIGSDVLDELEDSLFKASIALFAHLLVVIAFTLPRVVDMSKSDAIDVRVTRARSDDEQSRLQP